MLGTPTLLYTGGSSPSPIVPARFNAYYENEQYAEIPYPDNLKMIVGNPDATTESAMDPNAQASWYCDGDTADGAKEGGFPANTCPSYLHHLLYFPDCVNTDTLAYTYSSDTGNTNWCPTGSKRITRLRFSIRYSLQSIIPQGWSGKAPLDLSSSNNTGVAWSSHGDFFNGWDPEAAKNMLSAPGNTFQYIAGSINNGEPTTSTCTASDADPNQGASDYETAYDLLSGKSTGSGTTSAGSIRAPSTSSSTTMATVYKAA